MSKKIIFLFTSIIFISNIHKAVHCQEKDLKIDIEPFSSERILLPSVEGEISDKKIKLSPPKEIIDAEEKAKEERKVLIIKMVILLLQGLL